MAIISKHQKTADRISNLPTNLIDHILSFLPTKGAVRTSSLSTYWNQQWRSIKCLDFENLKCNNDDLSVYEIKKAQTMFVSSVYRVLLFLKVNRLDSFKLRSEEYIDELHINEWVSAALERDVQQLDIDVPNLHGIFSPRSLFASRTLVVLKLGKDIDIHIPTSITLESLKILHLESVEFKDDDSLSRFISSCSALEDLKIQGYISILGRLKVISISSPLLKRLTLMDITYATSVLELYTYVFVLNTPNLQYFKHVDDPMPENYLIKRLPHLFQAEICLGLNSLDEDFFARDENTLNTLFAGISSVQCLCFSSQAVEVRNEMKCRLPIFSYLTYLKIYAGTLLTNFLESAPNLQTLVFEGDIVIYDSETGIIDNWYLPTTVPSCMLFHLLVIEVPVFHGLEEELQILRYFLGKSEVLEELRIGYKGFPNEQERVMSSIFALPRVSSSCKIVLM